MVFRDYRRSTRRERDWNRRGEPGGQEEYFRFQYEPVYEFYRDRWRSEDDSEDWDRQPPERRTAQDPDFRFQYEPVYEIYRDRWEEDEGDRDLHTGERGWQNRAEQDRYFRRSAADPGHRRRFERGNVDPERWQPRQQAGRASRRWEPGRPEISAGSGWPEVEEWQIPGPYTGYGPRGYRRSDERLREQIYERLTMNGWLDATQINIDVQDGQVTLTGTVKNRREKRLAEETVEDLMGSMLSNSQQVNNHLTVAQSEEEGRTRGYWGETAGLGGRLREGMAVVGRDGDFIGTVKRVRPNDFLLDRPWARDIYVPFQAIRRLGSRVALNVAADEVGEEDWDRPSIF
ncbi:MAG TPA: BON domain-containing protein [Anaerolineaceae bacterium]|nr:BON domain-containing protein [Anaerolineaceae bacterium]